MTKIIFKEIAFYVLLPHHILVPIAFIQILEIFQNSSKFENTKNISRYEPNKEKTSRPLSLEKFQKQLLLDIGFENVFIDVSRNPVSRCRSRGYNRIKPTY